MTTDDRELASALADVDEPVFARHVFTADEVTGVIDRMKLARATCDDCPRMSYEGALRGVWFQRYMAAAEVGNTGGVIVSRSQTADYMREHGFQEMADAPSWIKRCVTCRDKPAFPWADQLDLARVLRFVNTDPRCEGPWPLALLETTLPGYVPPPPPPEAAPTPGSFESLAAEAGGATEAETHRAEL